MAWGLGFAWMGRGGSWTVLGWLSVAAALRLVIVDAEVRRLLIPSSANFFLGLVGAMVMTAPTRLLFPIVADLIPGLRGATHQLYGILATSRHSPLELALLLALVSSSEEIVWRSRVLASPTDAEPRAWPNRAEVIQAFPGALVYAFAHTPSHSPLLVILAWVCGMVWGVIRISTRSVWPSVVTHSLWDLAIMVVWPLS
jgi:uncharacterized protein